MAFREMFPAGYSELSQGGKIAPSCPLREANHSAGFVSSCPVTELGIYLTSADLGAKKLTWAILWCCIPPNTLHIPWCSTETNRILLTSAN